MQEIIRLVPRVTTGPCSVYQNTGNQNGQGMELELVWDVNRSLRVSGNYAHQRSVDETTQQDAG